MNLKQLMKRNKIPGVGIAIVKNNKITDLFYYGFKSHKEKSPIDENVLFQAASISKPVAAIAVLILAHKGVLDLDVDIKTYLKDWNVNEKVTLRQLLSHTGGIGVFGFKGYVRKSKIPSLFEIIKGKGNTPKINIISKVGKFSYSGGGYCLIQKILTHVLKDSFPNILHRLVLKPLKMKNSTFKQPLPRQLCDRAAIGHLQNGRKVTKDWYVYPQMAAAGLWSTSHDLALFLIELQKAYKGKSKILPREIVREMLKPHTAGSAGAMGFGLEIIHNKTYFIHKGSNCGFKCKLLGGITNGRGIVVMTNSDNGHRLIARLEKYFLF